MDAEFNNAVMAARGSLVRVRFIRGWWAYNAGMVAGLPPKYAAELSAIGQVEILDPQEEQAEVVPHAPPADSPDDPSTLDIESNRALEALMDPPGTTGVSDETADLQPPKTRKRRRRRGR